MRLELIAYLLCGFLSLISAVDRNSCDCSFFSIKSRLCSEDQTCCKNKYDEMGCCPYKNAICCPGGQCCPFGMKCNLDKMQCEYKKVNQIKYLFAWKLLNTCVSFIPFLFLVTFGNKVTKIRKYYLCLHFAWQDGQDGKKPERKSHN